MLETLKGHIEAFQEFLHYSDRMPLWLRKWLLGYDPSPSVRTGPLADWGTIVSATMNNNPQLAESITANNALLAYLQRPKT